jgi:hypothetical protein
MRIYVDDFEIVKDHLHDRYTMKIAFHSEPNCNVKYAALAFPPGIELEWKVWDVEAWIDTMVNRLQLLKDEVERQLGEEYANT